METILMNEDEVAETMCVSKAYAYRVIKQLNKELNALGYITVSGKVNRKYFMLKINFQEGKEAK